MTIGRPYQVTDIPPVEIGWWRRRPSQRHSRKRRAAALLGLSMSVALHMLLLAPIWYGGSHRRVRQPERQDDAVSAGESAEKAEITAFFIDNSAISESEADPNEPGPAFLPKLKKLTVDGENLAAKIKLPVADQVPDDTASAEAAGDQANRAAMFGRYVGQITARIERAWIRPRSPLPGTFACMVKVTQDSRGNVMETTLQRCTGSLRWQASLVAAIEHSSPLPAPPEQAVFSSTITIEIESAPYVQDGTEEGFEPRAAPGLQAEAAAAEAAQFGTKLDELHRLNGTSATPINLTIVGQPDASVQAPRDATANEDQPDAHPSDSMNSQGNSEPDPE